MENKNLKPRMYKIGVVCGRFQPLHNGHLDYIINALNQSEHIIIGITNPDPGLTSPDPTCIHRSIVSSNPFTYYERYIMIRNSLLEIDINYYQFDIVPFPINMPQLYRYYAPLEAEYFVDIFDEWGDKKIELLKSGGIKNISTRSFKNIDKKIRSTIIRSLMKSNGDWRRLVPCAVIKLVDEIGLIGINERM